MKKITLTLLTTALLVTSIPAFADTKKTDNTHAFSFEVNEQWSEIGRQIPQERRKGDYKKAIELSKKLISIAEQKKGKNHPSSVLSYQALGLSYLGTEQIAESNQAFMTAEEITNTLAKKPEYANYQKEISSYSAFSTQFIAKNFYILKDKKKSLEYAHKADKHHRFTKANIYDFSDNLELIAQIYYEQEDKRYLPALLDLLDINKFRLGKQDKKYLNWTNALVDYYMKNKQPKKAIALYKSMISQLEKMDDKSSTELMISYQALGFIYRANEQYQESLAVLQKYMKKANSIHGEDSIYSLPAYIQVGSAYVYLNDKKKAKKYLLEAREKVKKIEQKMKLKQGDNNKHVTEINFANKMIDKYLAMIK